MHSYINYYFFSVPISSGIGQHYKEDAMACIQKCHIYFPKATPKSWKALSSAGLQLCFIVNAGNKYPVWLFYIHQQRNNQTFHWDQWRSTKYLSFEAAQGSIDSLSCSFAGLRLPLPLLGTNRVAVFQSTSSRQITPMERARQHIKCPVTHTFPRRNDAISLQTKVDALIWQSSAKPPRVRGFVQGAALKPSGSAV